MNIELNLGVGGMFCVLLGTTFLLLSALEGLDIFRVSHRFRTSPLALALLGASSTIMPVGLALAYSGGGWLSFLPLIWAMTLLIAGAQVEKRARAEPPYNKSLQQTFDPVANSADAESSPASNAAELQRYTAPVNSAGASRHGANSDREYLDAHGFQSGKANTR